jgi:hypothetical protein
VVGVLGGECLLDAPLPGLASIIGTGSGTVIRRRSRRSRWFSGGLRVTNCFGLESSGIRVNRFRFGLRGARRDGREPRPLGQRIVEYQLRRLGCDLRYPRARFILRERVVAIKLVLSERIRVAGRLAGFSIQTCTQRLGEV